MDNLSRQRASVTAQFTTRPRRVQTVMQANMSLKFLITAIVFTQATSEWVEISQQYKKPIKPTHNHPLLATTISDNDRSKPNVNHSVQEEHWSTGLEKRKVNRVEYNSDSVNLKGNSGDRPVLIRGDNKVSDVVIRKTESSTPNGPRTSATKLEEYKEHTIEVFNLSDLKPFEEDAVKSEFDKEIEKTNRKKNVARNTTPALTTRSVADNKRYTEKSTSTTNTHTRTTANSNRKQVSNGNGNKENILKIKGNNMRRVEILGGQHSATTNIQTVRDEHEVRSTAYKFPNIGQVKRVHLNTSTVRGTHKPNPDINRYSSTELHEKQDFADSKNQNQIRKVDNISSLQRWTPEGVFFVKNDKNRFENFKLVTHEKNPEDIMIEELLNDGKDITVHKVATIGTIKRISPSEIANIHRRNDGSVRPFTETSYETETEVLVEDEANIDLYDKSNFNPIIANGTERSIVTTMKVKPKTNPASKGPEINTQIERYETNPYRNVRPSLGPPPDFVTKEDLDETPGFEDNYATTKVTTESTIKIKVNTESSRKKITSEHFRFHKLNEPIKDENSNQKSEEGPSNESKFSAMENLIKFLKTVTDIITRNTRRGVQDKMRYLEDLRDTILANIEERIEAAFPNDVGGKRRSRSTAEPRGHHVEFPSSESALMTISFLTFAVFLIKLVLQLIQAYKNKTMMVMPTMVAAVGRAINDRRSE